MKSVVGYLVFEGNCREAMEFYARGLSARMEAMDAGSMPQCPAGKEGQVLHARLDRDGTTLLMASDNLMDGPLTMGTNFSVSLDCSSAAEQEQMFGALSSGGTVKMELQDTFWGARFGMLRDRFGVNWMLNFDKDHSASA